MDTTTQHATPIMVEVLVRCSEHVTTLNLAAEYQVMGTDKSQYYCCTVVSRNNSTEEDTPIVQQCTTTPNAAAASLDSAFDGRIFSGQRATSANCNISPPRWRAARSSCKPLDTPCPKARCRCPQRMCAAAPFHGWQALCGRYSTC